MVTFNLDSTGILIEILHQSGFRKNNRDHKSYSQPKLLILFNLRKLLILFNLRDINYGLFCKTFFENDLTIHTVLAKKEIARDTLDSKFRITE